MTNETEVVDEIEDIGEDPIEEDTTDWKAEALKARGIAKRNATRLEKLKKAADTKIETVTPPVKEENKQFDRADKAFLKASGIKSDEYDFVLETMQSTGKDLDSILESKYFQSELKERRDVEETKEAIPSGTRRSTAPTRDSVEWWKAKIESGTSTILDITDLKLRKEVLEARKESHRDKNTFSDTPIV